MNAKQFNSNDEKKVICYLLLTQAVVTGLILMVVIHLSDYHHRFQEPDVANFSNNSITRHFYHPGFSDSNEKLCPESGKDLKMFIMVNTDPRNVSVRIAIRKTWAKWVERRDLSIGFFIGNIANKFIEKIVKIESIIFNDIIRCNFLDSYKNLTLKTISMLEWTHTYCPKTEYIFKVDDDMFINIPNLLLYVSKLKSHERKLYGGIAARPYRVFRKKTSRYFVSKQEYIHKNYPLFLPGPSYLVPTKLVKELYDTALNTTFFKLEDVFLTGIVAKTLNVTRNISDAFENFLKNFTYCSVRNKIAVHKVNVTLMYGIWYSLLYEKEPCKKNETLSFKIPASWPSIPDDIVQL